MNRKVVGGLHRVLRRSPLVFAFVCALVLAGVSFYHSNDIQGHHGVLRVTGTQGLRQIYEPETFRLSSSKKPATISKPPSEFSVSSEDSLKSLKELVRDAVDRGLVVIINASDADAAHIIADHSQGARLDISRGLDGPTGEMLVEVIQELRNLEDMATEVAELKRKIKRYEAQGDECESKTANNRTSGMALRQGDHGFRAAGRPLHPLVIFSAFRFDPNEFTIVGLAAPSLLRKTFFELEENACTWVEWEDDTSSATKLPSPSKTDGKLQRGEKRTILINDGDSPYAVVVIKCRFADPAGSNSYGGHLFINSTMKDHVPVLTEPPEFINNIQFEGALQHRFALCTPPIWTPLNAKHLKQWLMYHHHILGRERIHYFFYTGIPLDEETARVLEPLLAQQMVTIIDLSLEWNLVGEESQFPTTLLARNDCVQRARFFADWAVLWDFDEFLQMFPPNDDLLSILDSNGDVPYIAFGNLRWSSAYCTRAVNETESESSTSGEPWAIDRMIFRLGLPSCGDKNESKCVGGEGMRRYIVNPRKVYAVHNHFTIDPSWGGADIPNGAARVNHYIGNFLSPKRDETCTIVKEPDEIDPSVAVDGFWHKDESFSSLSRRAHAATRNSSLFNTRLRESGTKHRRSQAQNFTMDVR